MNTYIQDRYGNPCRGCGFDWKIRAADSQRIILAAPRVLREALSTSDGPETIRGLDWSVSAYVAHVADNTRIWAERVAASALGAVGPVMPYEENALADARGYPGLALEGTLWSLDRALDDWHEAEELAGDHGSVLNHPEQGMLDLDDVRRRVAHELYHHGKDIERIVAGPQ